MPPIARIVTRAFERIADLGMRRPWRVIVTALILFVICLAAIPGLRVSTSRYGLVSEDNPFQARLARFFDRFGFPDTTMILVADGSEQGRRATVDALLHELDQDPALHGRILARVGPELVAETLALRDPAALLEFRRTLPEGFDLPATIEKGLPGVFEALGAQLESGDAAPGDDARVREGLLGLARAADAFTAAVGGGDALAALEVHDALVRPGVDAAGYLVTADGSANVVTLFPDFPGDEVQDLAPVVERIRDTRDRVLTRLAGDVTADVTGVPALAVDELVLIQRGLFQTSIAAAVAVFMLCLFFLRSLRQTFIAFMPVAIGSIVTMACARLIYGELNLVTSSFVAVLMGLGVDFAAHVVVRYNELVREGRPVADAIRTALTSTGPGIVAGAVATACAFLTLLTVEFTAFAQLGVVTTAGLVVILAATFFLLPALLTLGSGAGRVLPAPPGVGQLVALVRAVPGLLLAIAALMAIAGAIALPHIAYNPRFFDFLPEKHESARALVRIEYDAVASPVFANLTADGVEQARSMTERLRAMPEVAGVQTATDMLPAPGPDAIAALRGFFAGLRDPDFAALGAHRSDPVALAKKARDLADGLDEIRFALEQAGRETTAAERAKQAFEGLSAALEKLDDAGRTRLAELEAMLADVARRAWTTARKVAERGEVAPSDLPEVMRSRFVSRDGKSLALYVIPAGDLWNREVAQAFKDAVESVDPEASGLALNHLEHGSMIIHGFRRAAALAAIMILVLLLLDFRNLRDAMLALLPTVLGWLWMLGTMAATGIRFDTANFVILPLVMGIGVAFGVHLVHRLREAERGSDGPPSLDEIMRGTGAGVLVAATTTIAGFASLVLGDYRAMKTFGTSMVIGVTSCLIASVVVLPALLRVLGRAR